MSLIRIAVLLGFIAAPLIVLCGFTMFRYPEAWAKGNARLAHKELSEFNSPRQLERTKRTGKLFMAIGAFECLSMLGLITMLRMMR
jgi:hypothetical protein